MILFNIALSIFLTTSDLYCWKKYQDKKFLFISVIGGLITSFNILIYIYSKTPHFFSSILTTLLLVIVSWYDWKKFKDKIYFWFLSLSIVLLVVRTYNFYFNANLEQFSLEYKLTSSTMVIILLIGIIITTVIVLIINQKKQE